MKKNKIVILTGNNNFFGQTRKPWVSMDVKKMQAVFEKHDFTVQILSFNEIVNDKAEIKVSFSVPTIVFLNLPDKI